MSDDHTPTPKLFVRVQDIPKNTGRFQGFNVVLEKVTPGVPFFRESMIANTFFIAPGHELNAPQKRKDANDYARGLARLLDATVETSEG
jgi:hypothetical protein